MANNNNKNRPLRSWETKESRYYCAVCNVWMGNDRQSILLHENGKKHKENVAKSLQDKRNERAQQEKHTAQQKGALAAMERAALQAIHTGSDSLYYDTSNLTTGGTTTDPYSGVPSYPAGVPPPPPPPPPAAAKPSSAPTKKDKKEKEEWNARKKQRKEKGGEDDDDPTTTKSSGSTTKKVIAPDEGFYTITTTTSDNDNNNNETTTTTYLEGIVYNEILEEEMPIQIWTGSNLASAEEKKLLHHQDLWMNGLVVAIRKRKNQQQLDNNNGNDGDNDKVVDVAYLKNPTDTEETLERGVLLHRIRIILGGDESIPDTLEEARILAMGGEEIHHHSSETAAGAAAAAAEIDEATGFTTWSTVTIKRTTVHQQAREERAKQRQKERALKKAAQEEIQKAQLRKMEESKVQNAEDSALGAFDVWSQTQRGGYKGVDIHTEATVSVEDTAKKLSSGGAGEKVTFKKKSKLFKNKAGKKRNRRTTSADDDD